MITSAQLERYHQQLRKMIVTMLVKHPYFGFASVQTTRSFNDAFPNIAGMRITQYGLVIVFNPNLFFKRSEDDQVFIFVHELVHFLFKHPFRAKVRAKAGISTGFSYIDHLIDNIAMDLAVNSFLRKYFSYSVPEGVLLPERFGLPDDKTYEWYRANLTEEMVEPFVDYELHNWEIEVSDVEGEGLASQIHHSSCRQAGTEAYGQLRDIYRVDAEIDFREVLLRLAESARLNSQQTIETKRRLSRRYDTVPGTKQGYGGEVHWLQDTSGSMSAEHIGACYVIGDKIRKKGIPLTVYEFDGDFIREYPYVGIPPQVKGGGGTMIQSTFEHIRKNKPWVKDVVVFTDAGIGDLGDEMPEGFRSVTWIVPEGFSADHIKWGRVVTMRMDRHDKAA